MESYKILEHTADVGLIINGSTLPELFLNAVKGLFHIVSPALGVCAGPQDVFPSAKHLAVVELKAAAEEELLVYWLNEFVYYFFVKDLFPKRIEIDNLEKGEIRARVDFGKRTGTIQIATEVKAATYHQLSIKRKDTNFKAQVIFDV